MPRAIEPMKRLKQNIKKIKSGRFIFLIVEMVVIHHAEHSNTIKS